MESTFSAALVHTGSCLFDCINIGADPRKILTCRLAFLRTRPILAGIDRARIWDTCCVCIDQDVVRRPSPLTINDHVAGEGRVGKATIPQVGGMISRNAGTIIAPTSGGSDLAHAGGENIVGNPEICQLWMISAIQNRD